MTRIKEIVLTNSWRFAGQILHFSQVMLPGYILLLMVGVCSWACRFWSFEVAAGPWHILLVAPGFDFLAECSPLSFVHLTRLWSLPNAINFVVSRRRDHSLFLLKDVKIIVLLAENGS